MTVDRNSRLAKWAYFLERRPYQTSLCAFFWRTVLVTPCKLAMMLVDFIAIGYIVWRVLLALYGRLAFSLSGAVVGLVIGLLVRWAVRGDNPPAERYALAIAHANTTRVLVEGFKSVKAKVCPVITLEP